MSKDTAQEKIKSQSKMAFSVTLLLTEDEARALAVLPSYGTEKFLSFFYNNLGRHYLEPHEKGLKSLFETIIDELPKHLRRIDKTRETFTNE